MGMNSFYSGDYVELYSRGSAKNASLRTGDTYEVKFDGTVYKVTACLIAAKVDSDLRTMVAIGNTALLTEDHVYTEERVEEKGGAGYYYVPAGAPPFLFAQVIKNESSVSYQLPTPCSDSYESSSWQESLEGSGVFYYKFAEGVDESLASGVVITPVKRVVAPVDETLLPPVYSEYFQCDVSIAEALTFITEWLTRLQAKVDGGKGDNVKNIAHFFYDHSEVKETEE